MNAWTLVYDDFDPDQEGLREALCTLGNGHFATRGALTYAEADGIHYPGTYLAGGYNRLTSEIDGHIIENEDLVNLPNWLPLTFRICDGPWFHLPDVDILAYRQALDMQRGILWHTIKFRDARGRQTTLTSRRFVHMYDPHLAAIEMTLTADNWSGSIEIKSALNGRVSNAGVARYRSLDCQHLEILDTKWVRDDIITLLVRTTQSHLEVSQAARTQLFRGSAPIIPAIRVFQNHGDIAQLLTCDIAPGESVTIEKVLALYDSRDTAISECGVAACQAVERAGRFHDLLRTHERAWAHLWHRFDIDLKEMEANLEDAYLRIVRLHIFHLLQVASPHIVERDVGVPARGLHGEAYRGHIFWDELFIFPLLNLRLPEITRSLLKYRYRRLPEARAAAARSGYRGAMFPWQSGSDGREENQVIHLNPRSGHWGPDDTHLQRHVNAAIVYNVWQYFQATRDMEFLSHFGAELILEIARFFASLATYNATIDRYEILGVVGPDEYHTAYPNAHEPGLNNNAYTNLMAVWVLCRALEVLALLPDDRGGELRETLGFSDGECEHWDNISRKMRIVFHDNGVISQFEGYDSLTEFDWEGYRQKYGDIQRLDRILEAEGDSPNRYKLSKQADVLMLFYLFSADELGTLFTRLGYAFPYETIPRNIAYYMARTSHGSTLSRVVHSWVLARSDRERSWQLFRQALASDITDVQGGTTAEGIHLGAMAGTVDVLQRCYTGIEIRGEVLYLHPCLPKDLTNLHLDIRYCGHSLALDITPDTLTIKTLPSMASAITICVNDEMHQLNADQSRVFHI